MRTARKIRYRLEWLALKSAMKFLPLLSRKACYRLALCLGSLGAMLAGSKWKVKCLDLTPILNSPDSQLSFALLAFTANFTGVSASPSLQ
jgi:hypothetical protein